jgi:hypothetical protein
MFCLIKNTEFNIYNIHFLEKKINMMMDGFFTKIMFATSFMTMNGIFINIPFISVTTNYSNYLSIDTEKEKEYIYRFCIMEKQILQYYLMFYNIRKTPIYNLKSQLQKGYIKYYRDIHGPSKDTGFYLKISGIWENHNEIGMTYKIIEYRKI